MIPISRNRFIGILVAICQLVLVTFAMPSKALESLGASEDTADIVVGCLYPCPDELVFWVGIQW